MIPHKFMRFRGDNKPWHQQIAVHSEWEKSQYPTLYCRLHPVVCYRDRVLILVSITAAGSTRSFKSIKTHKCSQTPSVSHVSYMWPKFTLSQPLLKTQYVYLTVDETQLYNAWRSLNIYWRQRECSWMGVWWVDGKINILRIFRLVWSLAVMKGIRMRKHWFLGDKERACRNLDVRSNSNRLPRN